MADQEQSGEKTEEATPRHREEAREKGQVPLSTELISAVMLCASLGALLLGGERLAKSSGGIVREALLSLPDLGVQELAVADYASLLEHSVTRAVEAIAAVFLPVMAIGLLVSYGQIGFRMTPKAVAADPSKIDPIKGLGRIFSKRSLVRTGMALLKILAVAVTMAAIAWGQLPNIVRMGGSELGPLLAGLGHVALRCTLGALVAILGLALLDLLYQRFQHDQDLRMTKEEVKEERKTTEGDPFVKGRIRQIQREIARRRMMADVPKATVVVTNPTHYAVALRYDGRDGAQAAPRVVAKGVDHLAQRIKELARESGVICYEDVPLARSLYGQVGIGEEIPEKLYAAVAVVLNYVYRLQPERAPKSSAAAGAARAA